MPAVAKDIREFVTLASQKHVKSMIVKKNGNETKFKLRGSRLSYTLVVGDEDRAKKIISSLPPGLNIVEIDTRAPNTSVF